MTEGSTNKTVDYLGGFQYENNELNFFPTAEGYVKKTSKSINDDFFNYVYTYTDHLGNIRLRYTRYPSDLSKVKILEENHYYPFGLKHEGYNNEHEVIVPPFASKGGQVEITPITPAFGEVFKYKYNGKELQDELGLDWYDYGARNYDPALGRWMNLDPLMEEYASWSPYNYVLGNPVRFVDPTGMFVEESGGYRKLDPKDSRADGRSVSDCGCPDPPCWFETTLNAIKSTEITSISLGAGVGARIMNTGGAVSLINFSYDFKEETFSFKATEGFIGLGIPGHSINAEADIAYSAKNFKDETAEGGFIRLSGNTEWEDNKSNGSVSLFAKSHQGEKGALIFDGNNTKSSEREFTNPDVNFSGKIKAIFGVGFSFNTKKFKQLQEKSKAEAKQSKNQTLLWGEIKQLPPKRR